MHEFKVIPHSSIGPIQLGMVRDEVRQILGEPSSVEVAHVKWDIPWPDRDFFFNNAFQVTYDSTLKAVHIEASADSSYTITFDGVSVHDASPQEVIEAIRKYAAVDDQHREYPKNLRFPALDVNLYREHSDVDKFDTIGINVPSRARTIEASKAVNPSGF
jgi:hypothetical protein